MGELITILGIGLTLEYLLGWAFTRRPSEQVYQIELQSWPEAKAEADRIFERHSRND